MAEAWASGAAVSRQHWRWAAANDLVLPVFLSRFDPTQFAIEQYRSAGIMCPTNIAASVRKRQAEYFHGRLCARVALQHLGHAPVDVGTGPMREPLWPDGVVGSITHSRTIAAAIVLEASRYRGIGIDIEEIADAGTQEALLATVVSDAEHEVLRATHDLDASISLTAVFSAKESFFKALSGTVRRYFDFDAIALEHIDSENRTLLFVVRESLCTSWEAGQRVEIPFVLLPDNHVATLLTW